MITTTNSNSTGVQQVAERVKQAIEKNECEAFRLRRVGRKADAAAYETAARVLKIQLSRLIH